MVSMSPTNRATCTSYSSCMHSEQTQWPQGTMATSQLTVRHTGQVVFTEPTSALTRLWTGIREGVTMSHEGVTVSRLVSEFGHLRRSSQCPHPNHLYHQCAPIAHLRSLLSNGPLLVENHARPCNQDVHVFYKQFTGGSERMWVQSVMTPPSWQTRVDHIF